VHYIVKIIETFAQTIALPLINLLKKPAKKLSTLLNSPVRAIKFLVVMFLVLGGIDSIIDYFQTGNSSVLVFFPIFCALHYFIFKEDIKKLIEATDMMIKEDDPARQFSLLLTFLNDSLILFVLAPFIGIVLIIVMLMFSTLIEIIIVAIVFLIIVPMMLAVFLTAASFKKRKKITEFVKEKLEAAKRAFDNLLPAPRPIPSPVSAIYNHDSRRT
jgi:hypothetical protein